MKLFEVAQLLGKSVDEVEEMFKQEDVVSIDLSEKSASRRL